MVEPELGRGQQGPDELPARFFGAIAAMLEVPDQLARLIRVGLPAEHVADGQLDLFGRRWSFNNRPTSRPSPSERSSFSTRGHC